MCAGLSYRRSNSCPTHDVFWLYRGHLAETGALGGERNGSCNKTSFICTTARLESADHQSMVDMACGLASPLWERLFFVSCFYQDAAISGAVQLPVTQFWHSCLRA